MRNISHKFSTLRTARAQTSVHAGTATIKRIRDGKIPKGNALEISRTAALSGVKRCDELIPFCHSVPLDHVDVYFELKKTEVIIQSTATAVYKTGVEIEALLAVQLAALNLYDLLKPIDDHLSIGPTILLEKNGGHGGFGDVIRPPLRAAVLVTSDSTAAGKRKDKSGLIIRDRLVNEGVRVIVYSILPDEKKQIIDWLELQCRKKIDLILTTGGSGLGPRDCTVEALQEVMDKPVPGIAEAARAHGRERTPFAMLSRSVAGLKGQTLMVNLPGSSRGAEESMDALFPGLLHAFRMMRGGGH